MDKELRRRLIRHLERAVVYYDHELNYKNKTTRERAELKEAVDDANLLLRELRTQQ